MGQYSNDPLTDARIKRSHDNWVTNEDEWLRRVAHEEDEEEPTEGIKENLEEIPSNVDLEEEIRKHTDLFQADIEYPLRLTAIKFYELGRKARKEK